MKLIVGLGNPGEKYAQFRHNLGFAVLDALAKQFRVQSSWFVDRKFKSEIINYQLPTTNYQLVLAKPVTYMNNSGIAVSGLVNYFKVKPTDVIVIHDELDLPLGKIKVRLGGAAAGHHGVESIIESLGTDQFIRIRLGIGGSSFSAEKFVLQPFLHSEKSQVKHMIKKALKALDLILEKGLEKAQNQFN